MSKNSREATESAAGAILRMARLNCYDMAEEEKKEEKGMCKMLDLIEARGEARGEAKGKSKGMKLHVIELIMKKQQRGLSVSQIAEQIEEEEDTVQGICRVIKECGSGSTSEMIYAKLNLSGIE